MKISFNHLSAFSLKIILLFSILLLLVTKFSFSQTNYSPLYISSNFVKTIDLSRPVGTVAGSAGTTAAGGITYTIPIYTPPGTNGIQPSVNIVYNSQGGSGIVGFGWNIAGLSAITRTGKNLYHNGVVEPVSFTSEDAFLLDGMRLNPLVGANGANLTVYRTEMESFSTIVSHTSGTADNPDRFLVTAKDGNTMEFGFTTDSRIMSDDGLKVMLWRLNRIIDINGNYIDFKYTFSGRDSRIDEINYTGNTITGLIPYNKIKFSYGNRSEVNTLYDGGASLSSVYLLNKITINTEGEDLGGGETIIERVKTYEFNYGFDNVHSLLKEVIEYGEGFMSPPALNSTIFLYGDEPQNTSQVATAPFVGECITGDFNADGKTDILASTYYYENYNGQYIKNTNGYKILLDPQSSVTYYEKPLDPGHSIIENKKFVNFLTSDYNMDGRDDVFLVKTSVVTHPSGNVSRYLNRSLVIYSTDVGSLESELPIGNIYNSLEIHTSGNFIIPGDFDGDGNQDIVTMLRHTSSSFYEVKFNSPAKFSFNKTVAGFHFPAGVSDPIVLADLILPIDINGDGKNEVLVTRGSQSYIFSFRNEIQGNDIVFFATIILTTSDIVSTDKIFPGDFNGDRKTDLLVRQNNGNWKILTSTGKNFVSSSFTFSQTVNINNQYSDDKIVIADFNGDGKSDILHGFPVWVNGTSSSSKFSVFYSKGYSLFFNQLYNYNSVLPQTYSFLPTGDFNGDGRSDLLLKGYYPNSSGDIVYFKPNGKERLLLKVTDGHNVTTSFDYKLLTDKTSYPYVYNRTVPLSSSQNVNPFNYVQLPMYAVSSVTAPDGVGGTSTTSFFYEDAVVHRYAKGFLGFKKITSVNNTTFAKSITENEINTQFAVPYTVKQTALLAGQYPLPDEVIGETFITNSFVNLSIGSHDIRYFQKIDKTLSNDHLSGAANESINTYDNYGNITTNISKAGYLTGTVLNATETTTTTTTYGYHNTPFPAKPDIVTVNNQRNGMPAESATTTYSYTGSGLPASQVVFSGLPKAVTSSFSYNSFGNLLQSTTSASGVSNRSTITSFDTRGRYPVMKQIVAGSLSQSETMTYDNKWGSPLSKTSDCLTTTFQYDQFGRLKKTILPEGFEVNTSLHWDVQALQRFYSFTDFSAGKPDSKTWLDILGREIKTQVVGFNGQWLTQLTTYNERGFAATKTNSYYTSETPLVTTSYHDDYGRPYSVTNPLSTVNYSYTKLLDGKLQVTTTNSAGQSSTKITDATGKVITAIDNGGQLDYAYDSRGSQVEVKHGSTVLITNTYDIYGRQISMTDKNAGNISYQYDAYGQMIQQTDNGGNSYTMIYDDFGRITSRTGGEGTTTYTYYDPRFGRCNNQKLQSITGFNGVNKRFGYDQFNRLSTDRVTIDGVDYTTTYTYDTYGNLTKTTYPSGVEVNNIFDNNGNLVSINGGDSWNPVTLFTANAENGFGQLTSYTLGNGQTSQNTYQYGTPTRLYTPGIQDLNFTFDFTKGNLTSRFDAIKNLTESFQYDNLDRLTTTTVNGVQQLAINYDGSGSFSMGNITSKTDAGNYVYSNTKIHAVNYITNPAGPTAPPVTMLPSLDQHITYTPFLRAATITDGSVQTNITYGPDYERVKSFSNGGNTTKYFIGDMERVVSGSYTRDVHFIPVGNSLAIIEKPLYGNSIIHFVYKDYLGSLLTRTNINGTITAEQNFDAWGRLRNPADWQYLNYISNEFFNRGFTGHEHLPYHGLINMNARLYDQVQGRMISPDNYVPDPWHTQGYNRYSYANNNPLKYTDPDGNFFWFAVGAAALINGFIKGVSYDQKGMNFLGGFWRGAIVGGASAALGQIGGGTFLLNVSLGIGQGIGINGLSNTLDGNPFFQGAFTAGAIGGAFAAITSGLESYRNMHEGYGFGTNDGRITKMLKDKNYNGAIDFIKKRFGMNNANWHTEYGGKAYEKDLKGNTVAAITQLNPKADELDVTTGFSTYSIKSANALKGTVAHEYGHFRNFRKIDGIWQSPNSGFTGFFLEEFVDGYQNEINMASSMHISPNHLGRTIKIPDNFLPHITSSGKIWPAGIIPGNPVWANHGFFRIFRTVPTRYVFSSYF